MTKVIKKGIKNCHVLGVDSVVLSEDSGRLRRAFIAHEGHGLDVSDKLAVGFHPHHCDITIEVVSGALFNLNLEAGRSHLDKTTDCMELATYEYQSAILNEGKGGFKLSSKSKPHNMLCIPVTALDEPLFLTANIVHTILIPFYVAKSCTWVVTEGNEDPEYHPFVYSNRDLEHDKMEGLYQPMADEEADAVIAKVENQLLVARQVRAGIAAEKIGVTLPPEELKDFLAAVKSR